MIFSSIGEAIGTRVVPSAWSSFGAYLGRVAGSTLGSAIDQRLFGVQAHTQGARLTDVHIQASTEGASIPAVYGSIRIAGQVIWAARFKERTVTRSVGGGGKGGGPRATSTDYVYSLSFAIGLCEGEVARIGRAWANGEPFDLSQTTWRLHRGGEAQEPDPLIETIEGADHAPAYRGLAYIVFEDLPLAHFGNTIPQLSFEVIRPARAGDDSVRFEERVKGVCLIPGSGEFVYATEAVRRRSGPGQETAENVHAERDRANLLVSLDQLAADFPNCDSVMLVVAWFGDDLRCGECAIRPGVEIASKTTTPMTWRAGGVSRAGAHLVSQIDGAPAFGGTPSDASVLQAIAELKARGYKVGLYPFVLMDVPQDNALPDPYGGAAQAAYPWRGRITVHPAPGEPGSPDKTGAATAQVAAFFGVAAPADFGVSGGVPSYSGPAEWSYRRFILHNAKLAALAGVDAFIIASELRGLTTARDGAESFPVVAALRTLAADVRAILGTSVSLTYAADWSEYFGYQPQDGSGDVLFHLDPLWADANIDAVGIDWYPPLSDWREGGAHLDAALAPTVHDHAYLESRIEAGEDYDWYYASDADRDAQMRTPITDGAYNEPWVFRAKDIRNFWSRAHYDRPGGVRAGAPTAWAAESKPVWLIELGCPAVDKGANAPNLFVDSKSAESALPPYSTGARDDLIQRRTLDAYLRHWETDGVDNPVSALTGKPMIEQAFLWAWDARPYPAFPARTDVWTDGGAWRLGHWMNGRAGLSGLEDVVRDLCARAGVQDADTSGLRGAVSGYVVDSPATARDAIEPLMAAYDFSVAEHDGAITFVHHGARVPLAIAVEDLDAVSAGAPFAQRADAAELPVEARVRFLDPRRDYLIAGVSARRLDRADGGVISIEAPIALETEVAEAMARAVLADRRAAAESLQIGVGPVQLALEPGDHITLGGGADAFEISRIEDAESRKLDLRRARAPLAAQLSLADPGAPPLPPTAATPAFCVLDLPPLPTAETDERPLVAVFAAPWLGGHDIYAGASAELLTRRCRVTQPAIMGELTWPLEVGPVDRWDEANRFRISLYDGALASVTRDALLNGANAFAIESDGEWEVLQARDCVLVAPGVYELSGLLRGRLGSAHAMGSPHPAGARIVKLDDSLVRAEVAAHEWSEALLFSAPPTGAIAADPRSEEAIVTLPHAATRPWAPAHVRARLAGGGDVEVAWIRCARMGGEAWAPGEPPLGTPTEAYLVEILDGALVKRAFTATTSGLTYSAADQAADFGAPPVSLRIRVAQLDAAGRPGLNTELTITL